MTSLYNGTVREASLIVVVMSPLKALTLAVAPLRDAYGLLMLDHVGFCAKRVWSLHSVVLKMRAVQEWKETLPLPDRPLLAVAGGDSDISTPGLLSL